MTLPNPPAIPPQAVQMAQASADRIRAVYGVDAVRVVLAVGGDEVTVISSAPLANALPTR